MYRNKISIYRFSICIYVLLHNIRMSEIILSLLSNVESWKLISAELDVKFDLTYETCQFTRFDLEEIRKFRKYPLPHGWKFFLNQRYISSFKTYPTEWSIHLTRLQFPIKHLTRWEKKLEKVFLNFHASCLQQSKRRKTWNSRQQFRRGGGGERVASSRNRKWVFRFFKRPTFKGSLKKAVRRVETRIVLFTACTSAKYRLFN